MYSVRSELDERPGNVSSSLIHGCAFIPFPLYVPPHTASHCSPLRLARGKRKVDVGHLQPHGQNPPEGGLCCSFIDSSITCPKPFRLTTNSILAQIFFAWCSLYVTRLPRIRIPGQRPIFLFYLPLPTGNGDLFLTLYPDAHPSALYESFPTANGCLFGRPTRNFLAYPVTGKSG